MKIENLFQSNSYKSQLESLEWKSFASSVRRAKGNYCQCCRQGNVPTMVHHIFYKPDCKLWDYAMEDLIVLCSGCHKELHEQLNSFRKYVFKHLRPEQLRILNGAMLVGLTKSDPMEFVCAVAEMAASPSSIKRFAAAWVDRPAPKP